MFDVPSLTRAARRWSRVLVVASIAALPGAAGAEVPAKPKPSEQAPAFYAEVLILHATNEKKGIDPRIGPMPELAKPPFSSYDSYVLLDKARPLLDKQTPGTVKLPNGRSLETRLLEVLSPDLVRLSASINHPNGKEFLPLLEVKAKLNQAFIVAGQSYKHGILVLVIRAVK